MKFVCINYIRIKINYFIAFHSLEDRTYDYDINKVDSPADESPANDTSPINVLANDTHPIDVVAEKLDNMEMTA